MWAVLGVGMVAATVWIATPAISFRYRSVNGRLRQLPDLAEYGTQRLPQSVGKSMAMQLVLTGELFTARQMQAAGLVSEVVPEGALMARALELAVRSAELPPIAMTLAKASIMAAYELPLRP